MPYVKPCTRKDYFHSCTDAEREREIYDIKKGREKEGECKKMMTIGAILSG